MARDGLSSYLEHLENHGNDKIVVVALFRTDPDSPSKPSDWYSSGWSCRIIDSRRMGDEKLGVFCLWKTGLGYPQSGSNPVNPRWTIRLTFPLRVGKELLPTPKFQEEAGEDPMGVCSWGFDCFMEDK